MVFWAPWELPSLEVNLCRGGSSPLFWAWGPCMNYGNILFTLSSHLGKNISNIWWSLSQITWSCIQAFLHSLHSSLVFPMYCELLINIFSPVVNLCHGVLFFLLAPGSYHREGSWKNKKIEKEGKNSRDGGLKQVVTFCLAFEINLVHLWRNPADNFIRASPVAVHCMSLGSKFQIYHQLSSFIWRKQLYPAFVISLQVFFHLPFKKKLVISPLFLSYEAPNQFSSSELRRVRAVAPQHVSGKESNQF